MNERPIQMVPASAAPIAKGTRQPQSSSAACGIDITTTALTAAASSAPTSLAADASEAIRPRRATGALSTR